MTEEELIEQLLDEVVDEVIEIDRGKVERAISCIPVDYQRDLVRTYLDYLERIAECLD